MPDLGRSHEDHAMTRLLLAASTAALALSAAPALSQDWSGGYVGIHGGYGQTNDQDDERLRFDRNLDGNFGDTVTTAAGVGRAAARARAEGVGTGVAADGCDDDFDAAEAGVRAGWDFQFGAFVVGALVEYSGVSAEDSVTSYSTTPASYTFERKLENLAAVRARLGYAMGPALIYGTAGAARGEMSNQFYSSNGVNSFDAVVNDDQADGYQAGGGIEYRLAGNLTVTGEYIYTSLEAPDFTIRVGRGIAPANNPFVLTPNTTGTDITRSNGRFGLHAVRIGMNYRF
jgi:outer membrane immunogenic protein